MLNSLKIIKDSTEKISNLILYFLKSHLENIKQKYTFQTVDSKHFLLHTKIFSS